MIVVKNKSGYKKQYNIITSDKKTPDGIPIITVEGIQEERMSESSENIIGFCHRHPGKEKELSLDTDHVVVDFNDWFVLRKLCLDIQCFMCGATPKIPFNFKSNFGKKKPVNSMNWVCNACKKKVERMIKNETV